MRRYVKHILGNVSAVSLLVIIGIGLGVTIIEFRHYAVVPEPQLHLVDRLGKSTKSLARWTAAESIEDSEMAPSTKVGDTSNLRPEIRKVAGGASVAVTSERATHGIEAVETKAALQLGLSPEEAIRVVHLLSEIRYSQKEAKLLAEGYETASISFIRRAMMEARGDVVGEIVLAIGDDMYAEIQRKISIGGIERAIVGGMYGDLNIGGAPLTAGQVEQLAEIIGNHSIRNAQEGVQDDRRERGTVLLSSDMLADAASILSPVQLGQWIEHERQRQDASGLPKRVFGRTPGKRF